MTGRRPLDGARRAGHGHEVGRIEDQLAGSVINEALAEAQPIVAGIDPDMIMIRSREVLDTVGAAGDGEVEYEGVRPCTAPELITSRSADQGVVAPVAVDEVVTTRPLNTLAASLPASPLARSLPVPLIAAVPFRFQLLEERAQRVGDRAFRRIDTTVVDAGDGRLAYDVGKIVDPIEIVASPSIHDVGARSTIQQVVPGAAIELVVAAINLASGRV